MKGKEARSLRQTRADKAKKEAEAAKPAPKKPRPLSQARRRHVVHDLERLEKLAERVNELGVPAWKKKAPAITESTTEQDRVLIACGQQLEALLRKPEFAAALGSMHCMRQAYAVALRELGEQIDAINAGLPPADQLHAGLRDFATQYVMYQASKPFSEHTLMKMIADTLLPFMAEVLDKHTEQDNKDHAGVVALREEGRRKREVPIDIVTSAHQIGTGLGKERALVLAGYGPAISWILDKICKTVLEATDPEIGPFEIVRCLDAAPRERQQARYLRFAPNMWAGCANGDKEIAIFMGTQVADMLNAQPDLLVFDDLAKAHTAGFSLRVQAAAAGDAHRRLRKWCDKAGCGLIGSVPTDEFDWPDITAPEFEQLRTFADLRPVRVVPKDDDVEITIGEGGTMFTVPIAELEQHKRSPIIVPQ